jgi:hypothetical protein
LQNQFAFLGGDLEHLVFLRLDATKGEREKGADGGIARDKVVESGVDNLGGVHFLGEELGHQEIGEFGANRGLGDVAENEGGSDGDGSSRKPLLSFSAN